MKVALAAEGTRGDVYPMLSLAAALQRHGHEPLLCAPPDFQDVATERGVDFHPVGVSVLAFLQEHARVVAEGGPKIIGAFRAYARDSLRRQFQELPGACAGADLVIAAGVQAAAGSVAELHGIPYRYAIYCPVVIPSAEHAPLPIPWTGLPPWLNRVMWSIGKAAFNLPFRGPINRERRALGLAPISDVYHHLLSPRPILAADAELAPIPGDAALQMERVPCLHPVTPSELPPKLAAFLDAGPPPVYLGFGSMTDPEPAKTTSMLLDCVARLGCRALISEGWAGLGGEALPEGVMTVGSVSHASLFRRVSAVVHHGGAGTTTTAARAGAPQVIVPHLLDQYYWAHQVQRHGVGGPSLRRSRLDAACLADSIRSVVDNEWVANRAQELGERLSDQAQTDPVPAFLDGL